MESREVGSTRLNSPRRHVRPPLYGIQQLFRNFAAVIRQSIAPRTLVGKAGDILTARWLLWGIDCRARARGGGGSRDYRIAFRERLRGVVFAAVDVGRFWLPAVPYRRGGGGGGGGGEPQW